MKPDSRTPLGRRSAAKPRRAPSLARERATDGSDLRALLESLPLGLCVQQDFKPVFANEMFARLHGYADPGEILALDSILKLIPADQHALARERAAQRLTGGDAPNHFQERHLRKDGSEFLAEKTLRLVSWRGRPAIALLLTEATAGGAMALALGTSERRFRDFAEVASDWLWETDRDHRFTYVSERFREAAGIAPEMRIGKRRRDIDLTVTNQEQWTRHLADLDAHRPFKNLTYDYRDLSGRIRHVRVSGKPVFTPRGEFLGYRGTGTDITAEVEAIREAVRAHQRLADALENIPAAFSVFDSAERIEIVNEKMLQMYPGNPLLRTPGVTREEIVRWSLEHGELIPGESGPESWLEMRLRQFRDPPESFEFQLGDGR